MKSLVFLHNYIEKVLWELSEENNSYMTKEVLNLLKTANILLEYITTFIKYGIISEEEFNEWTSAK